MDARKELIKFLGKFMDPAQIDQALVFVDRIDHDSWAEGHHRGYCKARLEMEQPGPLAEDCGVTGVAV